MSYDLFFNTDSGRTIDKKSFATYFGERANYKVAKGQAVYQNDNTGVYFIFDEPSDSVVAFNLNFHRPHVFGLEAAVELETFAGAFGGLSAIDPQDDQSDGEPAAFDRERFLRAWNAGNAFAYRAMLKEQTEPPHTWPARRIRQVWDWNYARAAEQARDENVFLPAIFAMNVGGEVQSVAIWPPDCPILMPEVDALLAPVAQQGRHSKQLAMVPWNQVQPVVKPYQEKGAGLARYRLAFEAWPAEVAAFLAAKRAQMTGVEGIPWDQVLDREMVEEAGGGGSR
ncbi:MAG TPA: hypothetical protein VH475_27675 [Tepidisphaeraceae bacterium]|jgi:hypothetical protein